MTCSLHTLTTELLPTQLIKLTPLMRVNGEDLEITEPGADNTETTKKKKALEMKRDTEDGAALNTVERADAERVADMVPEKKSGMVLDTVLVTVLETDLGVVEEREIMRIQEKAQDTDLGAALMTVPMMVLVMVLMTVLEIDLGEVQEIDLGMALEMVQAKISMINQKKTLVMILKVIGITRNS